MHHRNPLLRGLLVLACLLLAACVSIPDRATGSFVERSIQMAGNPHRYQVFVPAAQARGGKLPIILFLHGSGERGSDNRIQLD